MVHRPITLDSTSKTTILKRTKDFIKKTTKLATLITRIHLRGGRIYFYYELLQFDPNYPGTVDQMIAERNFAEEPYARITLFVQDGSHCSVDWCRHTGQWVSMQKDTLEGCLQFIEKEEAYFHFPSSKGAKYNSTNNVE